MDTLEALVGQAVYVMKDMDPAASLDVTAACEAMLEEYRSLDGAMGDTVELSSLPENAIVVKAKMLLGIQSWDYTVNRKHMASMVVMGNVLYNKNMAVCWTATCRNCGPPSRHSQA